MLQLYDQVAVAEMTLFNTGRVGFDFVGIGMDACFETSPRHGVPIMMPHMVSIVPSCCYFLVQLVWIKDFASRVQFLLGRYERC